MLQKRKAENPESVKEEKRKPALLSTATLVALYEAEELHAPITQAYMYAAQEFKLAGNTTAAAEYAAKAVRVGLLWRGPGSREVVGMTKLVEELGG